MWVAGKYFSALFSTTYSVYWVNPLYLLERSQNSELSGRCLQKHLPRLEEAVDADAGEDEDGEEEQHHDQDPNPVVLKLERLEEYKKG